MEVRNERTFAGGEIHPARSIQGWRVVVGEGRVALRVHLIRLFGASRAPPPTNPIEREIMTVGEGSRCGSVHSQF